MTQVREGAWTPGPLEAVGISVFDKNADCVAICHPRLKLPGRASLTEMASNARLFAAAPDLFGALEEARGCIINLLILSGHHDDESVLRHFVVEEIDAALAKAALAREQGL